MERSANASTVRFREPFGKAADDLRSLSRRGMWELVLYLLVSTAFFLSRRADLLTPLSDSARVLLGAPPPALLTALAVGAYTFSAGVLILSRTVSGSRPVLKWSHLFFRTVFYPFFIFSGSLPEHFMPTFLAGLFLFALEHLNIWTWSLKVLPPKREALGKS